MYIVFIDEIMHPIVITLHRLGSAWVRGVGRQRWSDLVDGNSAVLVLLTISHGIVGKLCHPHWSTSHLLPPARHYTAALHVIASDRRTSCTARGSPANLNKVAISIDAFGTTRAARTIWTGSKHRNIVW